MDDRTIIVAPQAALNVKTLDKGEEEGFRFMGLDSSRERCQGLSRVAIEGCQGPTLPRKGGVG